MRKTQLNEVATIESGVSFRHRIEDDPEGDCWVIQMKDISNEDKIIINEPQSILIKEVNQKQLLSKGDVLFMAKGNNNFAIHYNLDRPAVAVSLFFVVRPNRTKVNSEFLTWFLNSANAQSYFHEQRLGASVGNIRKSVLESMEIDLPSMKRQGQVAKMNRLMHKEKELTSEYIAKKEILMNSVMNQIIEM